MRIKILGAAVVCVGRSGLSKTSLEEVAREAGVGRATVYRHFPGGRDEVIAQTIAFEVIGFFQRLADEVVDEVGLAAILEKALMFAHRTLADHEVLQKVLETEPERLLPHLSMSGPLITLAVTRYLQPILTVEHLTPGTVPVEAADFLARMVLSFIVGQGSWDLTDPASVHSLVCGQLLAGILADVDAPGVGRPTPLAALTLG